jgi:peptidylprolyl isomerase
MAAAQIGDIVQVRCNVLAGNQTVIAMSEGDKPLEFILGSEQVIQGLNRAVVGMHTGENKTVTVPPEEGFGPLQPKLVFRVRRAALPENVKVGDSIPAMLGAKSGNVWVTAIEAEYATVDGNYPLAGQSLVLQICVVEIRSATQASRAALKSAPSSPTPGSNLAHAGGGVPRSGTKPPRHSRHRKRH